MAYGKSSLRKFLTTSITFLAGGQVAYALPQDGQVVAGKATITTPSTTEMLIKQATDKAIVNWSAFSIAEKELVKFNQPSSAAVILNRVVGQSPSEILGKLVANGRVFLVNPNGIVFGKSAVVDVAGLVATTLDIRDEDFLNGNYDFEQIANKPLASVINRGEIRLTDNGFVMLVAPSVSNEGFIYAKLGKVILASGTEYRFDFLGDGLITYSVDSSNSSGSVLNVGVIKADGGDVILTTKAAENVFSSVVNNEGIIEAKSLEVKGGTVVLEGGTVENSGSIDVSSGESGAESGSVTIKGSSVKNSGSILASGAENSNAGSVEIFGSTKVDLKDSSDIEAKGEGEDSSGGFVEVSGNGVVNLSGRTDVSAEDGKPGKVVVDPEDVVLGSYVTGGGDYEVNATNSITVSDSAVISTRNVGSTNATEQISLPSVGDSGNLTFTAPNITIGTNATLVTFADNDYKSGTITLNAIGGSDTSLTIKSGALLKGGDVNLYSKAEEISTFGESDAEEGSETVTLDFLAYSSGVPFAGGAKEEAQASSKIIIEKGASIEGTNVDVESQAHAKAYVAEYLPVSNVAYSVSEPSSEVTINGNIKAAGTVNIYSYANEELTAKAQTVVKVDESRDSNNFYIGVAYGKGSLTSKLSVGDASLIEGSSVNIAAEGEESVEVKGVGNAYADGTLSGSVAIAELESTVESSVSGNVVSTSGDASIKSDLNIDNFAISTSSSSGTGKTAYLKPEYYLPANAITNFMTKNSPSAKSESNSSTFSFSAAFSYVNSDTSVTDEILSGASVSSAGNLNLSSTLTYPVSNIRMGASAGVNNNDSAKKDYSFAGAVSVALIKDDVETHVYSGSSLDAVGDLNVDSKIDMSYGRDTFDKYSGSLSSAEDYYNATKYYVGETVDYLENYAFPNNLVVSTSGGSVVGVAGMVDIAHFDETSKALVDDGVAINQNVDSYGKVNVNAYENLFFLNVAGDLAGELKPTDKSAVGGSYNDLEMKQTTIAQLGGTVNATALQVNAYSKDFAFNLGIAGGIADNYAISGSFSWLGIDKTTKAYTTEGSILNVGGDYITGNNAVVVSAFDENKAINVVGGIIVGHSVGIGASAVINDINRDTESYLSGVLNVSDGDTTVSATNDGLNLGIVIAGSVVTQSTKFSNVAEDDPLDGYSLPNLFGDEPQTPTTGIAAVFAGVVNLVNTKTSAYTDNLSFVASGGSDLYLNSRYSTDSYAISGTAAVTSTDSNGAGLNGAFMADYMSLDTESYLENSTITGADDLSLFSDDVSHAVTIGAGGAVASSDNSGALVGSVTKVKKNEDLLSYATNSTVTSNTFSASVKDSSGIVSAAVDISSAKIAAGASISINDVSGTESSYLNDSDVDSGSLFLESNSDRHLLSITASASAAKDSYLLAAASASFNLSNVDVSAYVAGKKKDGVKANELDVEAIDNSTSVVVSGALTASKNAVGIGASFTYNDLSDSVSSYLSDTSVNATSVRLVSYANPSVTDVSVSVAVSKTGVGFNVVINKEENDVESYVSNSNVTSSGSFVTASFYEGENSIYGGSIVGGSEVGIGGTGTANIVSNVVKAYSYNSTIVSGASSESVNLGDFSYSVTGIGIKAEGKEDWKTYVATGTLAKGGFFGFSGTVSVDTDKDDVESYIDDSDVTSASMVDVSAVHSSDVSVMDGSMAVTSGGAAGAGVAAGAIVFKEKTTSYIEQSRVKAASVSVSSETAETPFVTAVAGSIMGEVSIAGAIGVIVSESENEAYVTDSYLYSPVVNVNAKDTFSLQDGSLPGAIIGSLSATGGPAGLGGGVGVVKVNNKTYSFIAGSQVGTSAARATVNVSANATKSINYAVANVSVGDYLGLSGSVGVISIGSDTRAFIGSSSDRTSDVWANNLNVSSVDTTNIKGGVGNAAGSAGASIGASVNVVSIHSYNAAFIGDSTNVDANSVLIGADTDRDIDVKAIGLGAGFVGVQGTVSVVHVGSSFDSNEDKAMGDTSSGVDNSITDPFRLDTGVSDVNNEVSSDTSDDSVSDDLSEDSSFEDLTLASIGKNAHVVVHGNLSLMAKNSINVDSEIGGGAFGVAGIGGTVNVIKNYGNAEAYIDSGADVSFTVPGSLLDVKTDVSDNVTAVTYAGSGGGITLGAAVTYVDLGGNGLSYIGDYASISGDVNLNFSSSEGINVDVKSIGTSAGLAVAGITQSEVDVGGETAAYVGNNVDIGSSSNKVKSLNFSASRDDSVNVYSLPVNVGAASAVASDSEIDYDPYVKVYTGYSNTVYASGDYNAVATLTYGLNSKADGVNLGICTAGESLSQISLSPQVLSSIGSGNQVNVDNFYQASSITSDSFASSNAIPSVGGGLLAGSVGSYGYLSDGSVVKSSLGTDSKVVTEGGFSLFTQRAGSDYADAEGGVGGLLAIGESEAEVDFNGENGIYFDSGSSVNSQGDVNVKAQTTSTVQSKAVAGSGGVVSGDASYASVYVDDILNVSTDSNVAIYSHDSLSMNAYKSVTFNFFADSSQASVAGASGANAYGSVDESYSDIEIGDGSSLEASEISIVATNKLSQPQTITPNSSEGSGGVIEGSASYAHLNVSNTGSKVNVGSGVLIKLDGDYFSDNDVLIKAVNDFNFYEKAKLSSGGLIDLANSEADISATDNIYSTVSIGEGANFDVMGNVILASVTNAEGNVEASSYTYGGGSYADGSSSSTIKANDIVEIKDNAVVKASHKVTILAGADDNAVGYLKTKAYTDIYNKALVPFEGSPDATASSIRYATVKIDGGATVETGYDIDITATKGDLYAYGYGRAIDLYKKALEEIKEWFGDDDGSEEYTAGTSYTAGEGDVYVDGELQTGLYRKQYVTFGEDFNPGFYVTSYVDPTTNSTAYKLVPNTVVEDDGVWKVYDADGNYVKTLNPDEESNGVSWSLITDFTIEKSIEDKIQELEDLKANYGADSQTAQDIETEIEVLKGELTDSALSQTTHIIKLGTIYASSGNININADNLYGDGKLNAPGDVSIDVVNKSPLPIELGSLIIPWSHGGHVRFNTTSIHSSDDIAKVNTSHVRPDISVTDGENSPLPSISVISEAERKMYVTSDGSTLYLYPPPVIAGYSTTDGDDSGNTYIANMGGSVTIKGTGSIIVTEPISANTITLDAGANFIFNNPNAFYFVLGDPESQFSSTADSAQSIEGSNTGTYTDSDLENEASYVSYNTSLSNIDSYSGYTLAGNNIFINADIVDINGIIQSGIPDRKITIYADPISGAIKVQESSLWIDMDDGEPVLAKTLSYELKDGKIYIPDVSVQGGTVFISGKIINTGNNAKKGWINVMDGYGKIQITNLTNYPVVIEGVDTGGIEGKVTLVDKSKDNYGNWFDPDSSKYYLTTEYTRLGDTIQVYDNMGIDSSKPVKLEQTITGRIAEYKPLDNLYYYWLKGTETGTKTVTVYQHDYGKFLGFISYSDAHYEESWKVNEYTKTLSNDELPNGSVLGVYSFDGSSPYAYKHVRVTTQDSKHTDVDEWTEWHFLVKHTIVKWTVTEKKTDRDYYFNYVKADYPIKIHFIGYDTGSVNIYSSSNVEIAGVIRNPEGNTEITAPEILSKNVGLIQGQKISLRANVIGSQTAPIKITGSLVSGSYVIPEVSVFATGDVNLYAVDTNAMISSIETAGDVNIVGDKNLVFETYDPFAGTSLSGALIKGKNIYLESKFGSVSAEGGEFINVDTDADAGGTLTVLASNGDVKIRELTGDLYLNEIKTSGDVYVEVPFGNLIDANPNEKKDDRTIAELEELWNKLGLTGDSADELKEQEIEAYNRMMKRQYQDYWKNYRNLKVNPDGTYSYSDYQEVEFKLSDEEINALKAAGWTDDMIQDYEDKMTKLYNEWGQEPYNPNFTYNVQTDDPDQYNLLTDNTWTDRQLQNPLPSFLFKKDVTDTVYMTESPNIVGNNVYIFTGGSIGIDKQDIVYNYSDPDSIPEDEKDKVYLALAAAEIGDVKIDPDNKEIIIHQRDDIDVDANGKVTAVAAGHVYLGSDSKMTVYNLFSKDDWVRLKVYGDILASSGIVNITAPQGLILESADGAIGTPDVPLSVYLDSGSPIVARALNGINLLAPNGDLYVEYIYTPGDLTLSVPNGVIHDWSQDTEADIKADSALITAAGVGDSGGSDKALNLSLGSGDLEVFSSGDVNITNDGNTVLKDSSVKGDFYLTSEGDLSVSGNVLAGIVDFNVEGNTNISSDGRLASTSGYLSLQTQGNLDIEGSVYSSDWLLLKSSGDIQVTGKVGSAGELNIIGDGNSSLVMSGGRITAYTDNVTIDGLSSFSEENGSYIDSGNVLNIHASGDIKFDSSFAGAEFTYVKSDEGSLSVLNGGEIEGYSLLDVEAQKDVDIDGSLASEGGEIRVVTGAGSFNLYTSSGSVNSIAGERQVNISAAGDVNFDNYTSVYSLGDITVNSGGDFTSAAWINGKGSVNVNAGGNINVLNPGYVHSGSAAKVTIPDVQFVKNLVEFAEEESNDKQLLLDALSYVNDKFESAVSETENVWNGYYNYFEQTVRESPYYADVRSFVFDNNLEQYIPSQTIPVNSITDIVENFDIPDGSIDLPLPQTPVVSPSQINFVAGKDVNVKALLDTDGKVDINADGNVYLYSTVLGGKVNVVASGDLIQDKKAITYSESDVSYTGKSVELNGLTLSANKTSIAGSSVEVTGFTGGESISVNSTGNIDIQGGVYGINSLTLVSGGNASIEGIAGSNGLITINSGGDFYVSRLGIVESYGKVEDIFSGYMEQLPDFIKDVINNIPMPDNLVTGISVSSRDFTVDGAVLTTGDINVSGRNGVVSGVLSGSNVNVETSADFISLDNATVVALDSIKGYSGGSASLSGYYVSGKLISWNSTGDVDVDGLMGSAGGVVTEDMLSDFADVPGSLDREQMLSEVEEAVYKTITGEINLSSYNGNVSLKGEGVYAGDDVNISAGGYATISTFIIGGKGVNVRSAGDVEQEVGKIYAIDGNVTIEGDGNFVQESGVSVNASDSVMINVKGDSILSSVNAGNFAFVEAGGGIYDSDGNEVPYDYDIISPSVTLKADSGIGRPSDALDLKTSRLEASTLYGGIYIDNDGTLNVNDVVAGEGDIYLKVINGDMFINSLIEAKKGGVSLIVPDGYIMGEGLVKADKDSLFVAGKYIGLPFYPVNVDIKGSLSLRVYGKDDYYGISAYINGYTNPMFLNVENIPPGLVFLNNVSNGGLPQDNFFYGIDTEVSNTVNEIFKFFPRMKNFKFRQATDKIDEGIFRFYVNPNNLIQEENPLISLEQ
ncbi:filamentous hemagglutinin family N-terminal domain-containing protein [Desulfurobacterium pacificum]|uniref:Filamentous hemagglutinin family N-terminal domain-containing protein n=1 Tax=Desulfurobacterium pacificum TaxID=240166 RepID=A0ABY1NEP5_9BACT|nr:filamentous hemagglutinin N-terminal domain-containing protein [Desulfurobacterium pacificum]SMP07382.1 filamentous hemagglutinin family N-terminal domain-containing protein [Desulfurobacterium pacificum]